MVLDELDRAILACLQADARQSYRVIAPQVGTSVPTVSARIRRMEELGVIAGYTVRLADAPAAAAPGDVQVACHECQRMTGEPIEATLGGRRHAFCCPTCKRLFSERYDRMRQG